MNILQQTLEQMTVGKAQQKFMTQLLNTLQLIRGKVNFTSLSRHGDVSERTLRRHYSRPFDFNEFNHNLVTNAGICESDTLFAIDASFIPKSGKHTYGLDWFWNGCSGKAERGLEVSLVALIDQHQHSAFALSAKQTPARRSTKLSRSELYLRHLKEVRPHLPENVTCGVADNYYAKKDFVAGVRELDLHLISRLRIDANMRFLYRGPQKPRGRPRLYGDKVKLDDLRGFEAAGMLEGEVQLFTAVVQHVSLKRMIRIVLLVNTSDPDRPRQALLFSTDISLTAREIVRRYSARYQIEFLIRDAKQFTGLCDCQARSKQAIGFHLNASFAAVNVAKINARKNHDGQRAFVFSLASLKHRAFNIALLDRFMDSFELDSTLIKSHPGYTELCAYGTIAA